MRPSPTTSSSHRPPGAIGRGDAFVLSIANKVNATILSNDSFQEFHGQYHVAVRRGSPHRRQARAARRLGVRRRVCRCAGRSAAVAVQGRASARRGGGAGTATGTRGGRASAAAQSADAGAEGPAAQRKADAAGVGRRSPPRPRPRSPCRSAWPAASAPHQGGPRSTTSCRSSRSSSTIPWARSVNAVVETYSSHGAYVRVGDVNGYVPLRLMADPAPRSAREFMKIGEPVTLVVESFAPARRSIDLAVAGDGDCEAVEPPPAKARTVAQARPRRTAAAPAEPRRRRRADAKPASRQGHEGDQPRRRPDARRPRRQGQKAAPQPSAEQAPATKAADEPRRPSRPSRDGTRGGSRDRRRRAAGREQAPPRPRQEACAERAAKKAAEAAGQQRRAEPGDGTGTAQPAKRTRGQDGRHAGTGASHGRRRPPAQPARDERRCAPRVAVAAH